MYTKSAFGLKNPKPCTNGGDYVAEGMAGMQQSALGALTPVL